MAKLTRDEVEQIVKEARAKGEMPNLRKADLSGADLSRADLSGADLSKADLREANLSEADLSEADFSGVHLIAANLLEANLLGANLLGADLSEVNLKRTDLREADLKGVDFITADLKGTDLREANLGYTIFADVDLSLTKGLDTVNHRGPSTIGTDTLAHSKGQIPVSFLRGCGLSDLDIEYAKLHNPNLTANQITDIGYKIINFLTGDAIKYNTCFISYADQDRSFAERLYNNLQDSGVRCWYAPEDMKIGDKIRHRIDEAISEQDKLLLVLSKHSINSAWVEYEVDTALAREHKQKETILYPIRLDEDIMNLENGWALFIKRNRHIGDFCRWNDDTAYQQSLERLLRDLAAEAD